MKNWRIYSIVGVLILSVVLLVLKIKSLAKNIKIGITNGVAITKIGVKVIQIRLPIWFYNPFPNNIIVSDLDLKIYFEDYYVSTVKSPNNYKLESTKNSIYPILIDIEPRHLLKMLSDKGYMIDDPDWLNKVNVKIIGDVTADLGLMRLNNFPISLEDSLKSYVG